jgi:ABC-type uncharacterized transport system involved in gliding motility auxiliary subunit
MNRIKTRLNTVGLALLFAGLAAWRIWPYRKAVSLILVGLGLAAVAAYVALNLSSLKKGFTRKAFLYSGNLLLVVVLVLGILVLVNYFLSKHHTRVDLTSAKLHSLSGQSVKVLKSLKKDISVKAFFREGNPGRGTFENLMKIYAYESPRIKYELIDPDKNPGLVKRYEVTQDGMIVFESGDKDGRITAASEEDVTNAVIKLTREKKKVICFLEGHGEASVEESGDGGYSTVKGDLEKLGYEVKKQALALAEGFPADCALLVVPGPKKALLPNEIETIGKYVDRGGRVLFMIDPETDPGLSPLLAGYGVRLRNDLIVDTVSRLLGGDYFMPVVSEYEDHEITRGFRYATFFPYARSVEASETKPEGATLTVIAKTSPNSWSERRLDQKQVKFDKDLDGPGPVSLALVATLKAKAVEKSAAAAEGADAGAAATGAETPEARLAVVGDSDFAANRYLGLSGNANFFLNMVNWLTEEADLISIQPRTSSPRTLQMSPSQGRLLFFVSVILLPLAILVLGVAVWLRRRAL